MPRVDYERHGATYGRHRRPDPRIVAAIECALGDARTVLNVGAGTGSYEPAGRWVLAVEPSATMRAQRAPDAAPAISARAEALPLDDDSGWQRDFLAQGLQIEYPRFPSMETIAASLVEQRIVGRLRTALESGAWDAEHGHLRRQSSFDGSLRLVVAESP